MKARALIVIMPAFIGCNMNEPAIQIRTVDLPGDMTLEYAEQGDRSLTPVILLPGYTDPWQAYSLVLEHLPPSVHAIALSQRGQGRSSHPLTGYTPEDYGNDLLAFMDALAIERAVIVGHSMSSYAAQHFAIDHPDRARGLVLIGSFTTMRGNPGITTLYDSTISRFSDPVDPTFVRDFAVGTSSTRVPQDFLDTIVKWDLVVPAHVWKGALAALIAADHSDELGQVTAPTLLVWGDHDPLIQRPEQDALNAAIKSSRLLIYEGAGHSPNWEEPERFAQDLAAFIDGL